MTRDVAQRIITSRLLILQTKRLLLASIERRLEDTGLQPLRPRAERLRLEVDAAQHAYRSCVLALGSPERSDYWQIAYGRLIEMGSALTVKLRIAGPGLPPAERYQVATDVEMLESVVHGWTESKRAAMAATVA